MSQWVKLLSPKPFLEYSPEDFKNYVRSLYFKKQKKTPTIKIKKVLSIHLTKTGRVSLTVKRDPKFITRAEIERLAQEHNIEERLIWLRVRDKKKPIEVRDEIPKGS